VGTPKKESRVTRRQKRNRLALIEAGREVMSKKGIDAATMQEIADAADLGAGTIYSYFRSKEDLAIAVIESLMSNLAVRIEQVTNTFNDPARVYAYGIRTVLNTACQDERWKQLLYRSEVISKAIYSCFGPFAIRDLDNASKAGRFQIANTDLNWRLTSYAIVGVAIAITSGELPQDSIDQAVIRFLCMAGLEEQQAMELANLPCPPLAPE